MNIPKILYYYYFKNILLNLETEQYSIVKEFISKENLSIFQKFTNIKALDIDESIIDKAKKVFKYRINKRSIIEAKNIFDELNKNRVIYSLIKGPITSYYVFDDYYLRDYYDFDIIVSKEDYYKVCSILNKAGYYNPYVFAIDNFDQYPIDVQKRYYESIDYHDICFFSREISVDKYPIEIKSKYRESNNEFTEYLLNRTTIINLNGVSIKTNDVNDTFLIMLLNIFFYFGTTFGKKYKYKISTIYETIGFIYNQKINYKYCLEISKKYGLENKILYSIRLLNLFTDSNDFNIFLGINKVDKIKYLNKFNEFIHDKNKRLSYHYGILEKRIKLLKKFDIIPENDKPYVLKPRFKIKINRTFSLVEEDLFIEYDILDNC